MPAESTLQEPDVTEVAAALRVSIGLLLRRMRQVRPDGELSLPETSALARLDRSGPATSSALAKAEQISPQSMGATLSALEARGLITRDPDARDGRRVVLSVAEAGRQLRLAHREVLAETHISGLVDLSTTQMTVRAVTKVRPGSHTAMQNEYRRLLKHVMYQKAGADRTAVAA